MKNKVLLIFIFIAFVCPVFSIIYKIEKISEAENNLLALNDRDLAIFDIDDTLIVHSDSVLLPCNKWMLNFKMFKNFKELKKLSYDFFYSIVILGAKEEILEEKTVEIIHDLQKRNVKTIALTAAFPGRVGKIESVEDQRIQRLKSLGIDFDQPFLFDNLRFEDIKRYKNAPTYKEGIIFSSDAGKGRAIVAFLEKEQFTPQKVIMIDDRIHNLIDVEAEMIKKGIDFVGYEYGAAKNINCKTSHKVMDLQLEVLKKEKRWISEKEAEAMLLEQIK